MKPIIILSITLMLGFKANAQNYVDTFGMAYDRPIESFLYPDEPNIVITKYMGEGLQPLEKDIFFYRATMIQIKIHEIIVKNPPAPKLKDLRKYIDYLNYNKVEWQKERIWWTVWTKLNNYI